MKKILLTLVIAASSLAANAQVWAGGQLSMWRDYDANKTTFAILPEVGYSLSNKWDIATSIGYAYDYNNGTKMNSFVVAPYARYKWCTLGRVTVLTDLGFGFATGKVKIGDESSDAANSYEVGVKPGLAVSLNEKWGLVAHFGFLGFRNMNDNSLSNHFGDNGFGFDFKNGLSFGAYYNF